MPNYCEYAMKVRGQSKNIEKFLKIMTDYNEPVHFYRVFEANVSDEQINDDGTTSVLIDGYCAWSVHSCMRAGLGTYADDFPDSSTTLQKESERLCLDIEVFSSEPGFGFQEHYLYRQGVEEIDEERDWCCIWFYGYEGETEAERFESFLRENEINDLYTINDLDEDGALCIGGFDNYGNFMI